MIYFFTWSFCRSLEWNVNYFQLLGVQYAKPELPQAFRQRRTYWPAPKIDKLNETNRIHNELMLGRLDSLNDTSWTLPSNIAIVHKLKSVRREPSEDLTLELSSQFTDLPDRRVKRNSPTIRGSSTFYANVRSYLADGKGAPLTWLISLSQIKS